MTKLRCLSRGCSAALMLAAILIACDKPSGPTTPSPPPPPVTNNPTPALQGLLVGGPDTLAPAETVQFTLTARYSDGSTVDVTKDGIWQTNQSVLTVTTGGLVTGREPGESSISVSYGGRFGVKDVIVVPTGTFRVRGTVRDEGQGVRSAEVRVVSGPTAGLKTTTDQFGFYRLYGVGGDVEIEATRAGYNPTRRHLTVTEHSSVDFDLVLNEPRLTVAGTYTLTIAAPPDCASALPADARERQYQAVVTQVGPMLTVTLKGAKFFTFGNGAMLNIFEGAIEPGGLKFQIWSPDAYYGPFYTPDILEQVNETTWYSFSGLAVTTATPSGWTGSMNGLLRTMDSRRMLTGSCKSANHRFEFVR